MSSNKLNQIKQSAAKVAVLFIISVYLLFSVGIVKATHFCMGREVSVAFFTAEAKKCPCSLYAPEKGTCCDDQHELIRIENEQKTISTFSLAVPEWFVLEALYTEQWITAYQSAIPESFFYNDDLYPPKIPLWKANCCFIFYDTRAFG